MSDASGGFSNETAIGNLVSNTAGIISATIPQNTPGGTAYKVRIKSSNPAVISGESNVFEINLINSSIVLGSISGSPFVVSKIQGKVINIPFAVTGAFATNTFTAFLSDANGNFNNETPLGSINSNTDGSIVSLIPANTPDGNAYKVRVKSSNPALVSDESSALTVVLDSIQPTVNLGATVNDPTNVSPIEISVLFSEPITGFDLSIISVINGVKSNFVILGNSEFTFHISPLADGLVSAEIAANLVQDMIGNNNVVSNTWSTTYIQALGIEDLSKEGILIYPNPVSEFVTIKFEESQKMILLKVFGIDGKLHHSKVLLNKNQYQINFSEMSNGVYIVQFLVDGKLLNARIIKN